MATMSRRSFSAADIFELLNENNGARYYNKDYDDPLNQNAELCAKCGGHCCKRCGCFFSPDDFRVLNFEYLKQEIEKGYITIELVDLSEYYMEGFAYVVRARNANGPIVEKRLVRPCGPCILLGEHGCALDYNHRPTGGRLLVPREDGNCHAKYSTEHAIREWLNYQKLLRELADYFSEHLTSAI